MKAKRPFWVRVKGFVRHRRALRNIQRINRALIPLWHDGHPVEVDKMRMLLAEIAGRESCHRYLSNIPICAKSGAERDGE